jgi:twitching motility protein PilT
MPPLAPKEAQTLVYQMLTEDQKARFERDRELDFAITWQNRVRFRGNVFLQRGCVGAVLRVVPTRVPTFEELGLPPIVREVASREAGLVLVTGATGYGKSTTLAAMVEHVNQTRRAHIVTIEDPIEFVFENKLSVVEQREVGLDTNSFAAALRHALRQNPDVILLGEMRDLETMASALTAAETGHLVLSTLHTNDAVSAVNRILDVFPPHQQGQVRAQLALSLVAVIAQKLIPRADGSGLVLACEVLVNNSAVANLIREQKTHQLYTILETHARDGMCTMDASIRDLYLRGAISREDARARMRNPAALG